MSLETSNRVSRNGFKVIADSLRQRIEEGGLDTGRFLPTERELQEEFGASRSTVRRALSMLIDNGWAVNIPSKGVVAGSGARTTRTTNVALIDGSTFVMGLMVARLGDGFRKLGYHLVHTGGREGFLVEEALQYADDNNFAGALLWPYKGFPDMEAMQRLARRMPLVMLDNGYRGLDTDRVTFDHFQVGDTVTEHLIRVGHRRIGVTGFFDMMDSNHATFSGYMRAMFRHDLNPQSHDYVFTKTSGMEKADTRNLVARLRQPDRPSALFVLQDEEVPAVVEAIHEAGLRFPYDVAVATVGDDVDLDVDGVGLTAMAVDYTGMAEEAVRLLIRRIEDPTRTTRTKMVGTQLMVRGSCGAPQSQWTPPDLPTAFLSTPRQRYRFTSSSTSYGASSPDPTILAVEK
jgi:DNA-binding LacI/PurR family transcriptional regulator